MTEHYEHYSVIDGDVEIDVDFSKLSDRVNYAQYVLDTEIMKSMLPLMPHRTGILQQLTEARSQAVAGSGIVFASAGTPYARFQYYGKVMVGVNSKSPFAMKDEKKVVTERDINYSSPTAVPRWFEVAKRNDEKKWVETVKRELGAK